MTGIEIQGELRMGTLEVEMVHRGRAPANCAMGCPEYQSEDICWECYRRPIKSIEKATKPVMFRLDQTGEQIIEITEGK